jgi:hypothetical protein
VPDLLDRRNDRMFIIDQYKYGSNVIKVTMTPTAGFVAGINLTFSSGTITIDWKDGSAPENFTSGTEKTHTYTNAGTYIAEISGDIINITKFIADSCRITKIENLKTGLLTSFDIQSNLYSGVLNMSLAPISAMFNCRSNYITSIQFATSGNGLLTYFDCRSNNLTTLDFTNVPVSGSMSVSTNSNLISITFASSGNQGLYNFAALNCDLRTLDFTNVPIGRYPTYYSAFYIRSNLNFESITFASSGNGTFNEFEITSTKITSLDLNAVGISILYYLTVFNNSYLSSITFYSSNNGTLTRCWLNGNDVGYVDLTKSNFSLNINNSTIRLQDNNLSTSEVNHFLVDLDSISLSGYTGRTIDISGTNDSPDSFSGGYDGLAAKASLEGKGFTVTL